MSRPRIWYRDGYKYQLAGDYIVATSVTPDEEIVTEFIELTLAGIITIRKGYAWDGPSGPAIDTKNFMRGSLVHDALYQLMREGHLSESWRDEADGELRRMCIEDGMSALRAWWVYRGVRFGGGPAADPHRDRAPVSAP